MGTTGDSNMKILRPELLSGAARLQHNEMAKIFDHSF
jgi:hypothetical protein